jgi:hypothetical protein
MRKPINNILIGAAAGAAATWLMDQVTTRLYERQPREITDRENAVRGGKAAFDVAAEKALQAFGADADEEKRKKLASAIHWALGISAGAMYGALRNQAPFRTGSGVAFGVAFWLAVDELANSLLGLTPPPQQFPWQTHARGLAGHAVLGAAVELPYDLLDVWH